jgi:hypothetical protein
MARCTARRHRAADPHVGVGGDSRWWLDGDSGGLFSGSESGNELLDRVHGDPDRPADVYRLQFAGSDELIHLAPADPQCPTGFLDRKKEDEVCPPGGVLRASQARSGGRGTPRRFGSGGGTGSEPAGGLGNLIVSRPKLLCRRRSSAQSVHPPLPPTRAVVLGPPYAHPARESRQGFPTRAARPTNASSSLQAAPQPPPRPSPNSLAGRAPAARSSLPDSCREPMV